MHFLVTGSNNEETMCSIDFFSYRGICGISHVKIRIPHIVGLVFNLVDGEFYGFCIIFSFVHYCVFVISRIDHMVRRMTHTCNQGGVLRTLSFALSKGASMFGFRSSLGGCHRIGDFF